MVGLVGGDSVIATTTRWVLPSAHYGYHIHTVVPLAPTDGPDNAHTPYPHPRHDYILVLAGTPHTTHITLPPTHCAPYLPHTHVHVVLHYLQLCIHSQPLDLPCFRL